MSFTYLQVIEAQKAIKATPIKGKDYIEVNQRIKLLKLCDPDSQIITELVKDDGETCIFRASVISSEGKVLGTGTAFECKSSSFINKTSYIENCETSAVGRALAMCGIGIEYSIASYEEVANAIENQDKPVSKDELVEEAKLKTEVLAFLNKQKKEYISNVLEHFGVESPAQLTVENCKELLETINAKKGDK